MRPTDKSVVTPNADMPYCMSWYVALRLYRQYASKLMNDQQPDFKKEITMPQKKTQPTQEGRKCMRQPVRIVVVALVSGLVASQEN